MKKRADALAHYVNILESQLEKCRRDHGAAQDDGESYLQFRPVDAGGMILPDEMAADENYANSIPVTDSVATKELCVAPQNLRVCCRYSFTNSYQLTLFSSWTMVV